MTTESALFDLEADWNRLSGNAGLPNVFTTFDWYRAWSKGIAGEDPASRHGTCVLAIRNDGAVVGIVPLFRRTVSRFGLTVRKLEFLHSPADYNDFLLGDEASGQIAAVIAYLVDTQQEWDLIDLRSLHGAGHAITQLKNAIQQTDYGYRILPETPCPYLAIDSDAAGMMSRLSRSSRRTLRNQQYRLERMRAEGLGVRIIDAPQSEPGLLDKLIALECQKQVHREPVPPFFARYREVWQSLFDTLGPRGWFYVALMEMRGHPLAFQLGFRCGKSLWDFSKAYDADFSRLSPGTMLVPAVLDYGFSHGYQEYDFLRGEEPYKMKWSTSRHDTCRLLIWSRRWTSRARAFLYLDVKTAVYRATGRRGP